MRTVVFAILALLVVGVAHIANADAQEPTGSISGTVRYADPDDLRWEHLIFVLPSDVRQPIWGPSYMDGLIRTDRDGTFRTTELLPGEYLVIVGSHRGPVMNSEGFERVAISSVTSGPGWTIPAKRVTIREGEAITDINFLLVTEPQMDELPITGAPNSRSNSTDLFGIATILAVVAAAAVFAGAAMRIHGRRHAD